MSRVRLRWIGVRCGAVAGVSAGAIGVVLLAVRWAIDQMGGPVGELFVPAFYRGLMSLWSELFAGLPSYLAFGVMVGSIFGLGIAEAIGACSQRVPGGRLK